MRLFQSIRLVDKVVVQNRNGLLKIPHLSYRVFKPIKFHRSVYSSAILFNQQKAQYEYDPNTDSFRPKDQTSYTQQNTQQKGENKQKKFTFAKRFARNLFILTGSLVCGAAIFVSLFVNIKEEDLGLQLRDFDDEVRLLAFYDIVQSKNELAQIIAREKHLNDDEIHVITDRKQTAFLNVVKQIKEHEGILDSLGKPVHLCGFRAAEKIDHMIKSFLQVAQHGMKNQITDDFDKNTWKAECVLEGTKGLALLALEFERANEQSDWVLIKIEIESLDKSGTNIYNGTGCLPEGLNITG